ncbi:TPA: histidine--tRNA ligase [Candidatus Gastranaerophilales bacterium HUM_9]|nr:MAG TPA: histidine--tRNA ligase [Candidatus Gastranaerophilales bacterium HUM_9]HBX34670.1 histidine--tRNA ligase [Cyanobacteria bacterium UBA11440]
MGNIIKVQKGTKDILPQEMNLWHKMEENALRIFSNAGYQEIRTPIFEATELFARGVGDTTDIVNKEMYTFEKSERSLTLRPENTAGVVRSFIENGMHRLSAPVKLWYKGPMFRYERPQAGRQRQFHQVGVEMFGVKDATADAEVIELAVSYLKSLGLNDLEVEINSLGCPTCRENFKTKLKEVLKPYFNELCDDCKTRYEKNPLRLLDCKVESCKKIFEKPEIQEVIQGDFICDECSEHFSQLKTYLDALNIKYTVNKLLVRGLDYYNRTVFEIKSNNLGSQNAVCGGGRYDSLVKNLGGEDTPAIGFAMGMERLYSLIEKIEQEKLAGYIVSTNKAEALKLAKYLRDNNKSVDFDFAGKKFTKQMEKASKVAKFAIILGEDEISQGYVSIKNLENSEQNKVQKEDLLNIL